MPTWLAFDSGSPLTSAAVARDGAVLSTSSGESRNGPSLLWHLEHVRDVAGIGLGGLDGVVVLSGPGSFTGIRVGLATALGLRASIAAPVVALSNLAALALQVEPTTPSPILSLIDALRDEWFVQEFHRQAGGELMASGPPVRSAAATLAPPSDALLALHPGQRIPPVLSALARREASALAPAVAAAASTGTLRRLRSEALDPLYLRAFTPRTSAF